MNRNRTVLIALVVTALAGEALAQTGSLNNAVKKYNADDYAEAAFGFYEVAAFDPVLENRLKAEYYLAQSLNKNGQKRSAAFFYLAVMNQGPNHPYYLKAIEEIVEVAEFIRDDLFLPELVRREYNTKFAELPPATLYKINYLVGLANVRRQNPSEALSYLGAVPRESTYYPKSLYLRGIIKTFQDREGGVQAIRDYEEILEIEDTDEVQYWDLDNTKQLAILAIARTHYTLGDYTDSKDWFDRVERYSTYWDVALFENGWAAFLAEDVGSAMGSLHSLHAPQFSGSFQPESLILKATVYYFACLYSEVHKELATFDSKYKAMAEQANTLVTEHPDNEDLPLFLSLVATPDAQPEKLPVPVRNLMLDNQRVQSLLHQLNVLDAETESATNEKLWKGSSLQKEILSMLGQQREQNVLVTGRFIRARLAKLVSDVSNFDGQAEILRFETAKAEKVQLELGIDAESVLKGQRLLRPTMPGDEWAYWSFDGEWWVDELGYYKYTLKTACQEESGPGAN